MLTNKEIRKRASAMALESGTLLKLSLGVCFCVASAMIPFLISSLLAEFASLGAEEPNLVVSLDMIALGILLAVFLTLPVIGGFFGMAYKLYHAEKVHLAYIFSPFASAKKYFGIVFAGGLMLLRLVAIISIPVAVATLMSGVNLFEDAFLNGLLSGLAVGGAVALALLFAVCTMQMYFVPYFLCRGFGVTESISKSRALLKKRKGKLIGYILGFTGIFLLSLLTVGALFVVYTIPLMIFAYFIYADQLTSI
ncbi:MAG: hypothetical protein J6A83_01765 [Clostridia bacterium]|nr:hypothetical protein [Clostridia bacterium]